MSNFISVCVLSYNRLDFLKNSIRSMVANADEPLEIIVHDDGSGEPALREWLTCMVECGGISRLILNPAGHNEGQGIALNRMFSMAKGDIIVKADQDIIYRPGWTAAIRAALVDNAVLRGNGVTYGLPVLEPKIGALGLFKYHVAPVRYEDTLIGVGRRTYHQVTDFVGSVIAIPRASWWALGPFEERSEAFAEDAVFKQKITAHPDWCCALTVEDVVSNVGFGVGPSTLVKGFDPETKEGVLQQINHGPKLVHEIKG